MSEIKPKIKTRFAPSPTGLMHFGNVRAALFNYLFAKQQGGHFLLRIEDTDKVRSEVIFSDAILKDLEWLGLTWDEGPFYQSEREKLYQDFYDQLLDTNYAYPCFCTEQQLSITRKLQLSRGEPPRYPGTCRQLSEQAKEKKLAEGIKPTLRFHIPRGGIVEFEDLVKGPQRFENDHMGDFIIRRSDMTPPFMFCNAIDDALMGVTHALRGDDHLTNTPRQILIQKALGIAVPHYGHFPTILGPDGARLSKRNGSRSIQELREEGFHPLGIINYMARLGHYYENPEFQTLENLIEHFQLSKISHSPAHFDPQQLHYWQKETMHRLSLAEFVALISPFVENQIPKDKTELFASTVQPNIVMPHESSAWLDAIFAKQLIYTGEEGAVIHKTGPDFFLKAVQLLETHTTEKTEFHFKAWLEQLQTSTGLKGKALFFPLRAALTAMLHGPELARIIELMGIEQTIQRFKEAADFAKNHKSQNPQNPQNPHHSS